MNKQRKVVITTTYNEMGIIIDTKAEEVAQPNLQSTCNQLATDCINRQAAIDAFDGVKVDEENCTEYDIGYNDGIDFAVSRLSVLQPAQPEQRWIPCSERLPKDYEDVLVWYEYFRYSGYNRIAQTWDVGYYISEFNRWGGGVTGQKVRAIAWMPLPEPYRRANDG